MRFFIPTATGLLIASPLLADNPPPIHTIDAAIEAFDQHDQARAQEDLALSQTKTDEAKPEPVLVTGKKPDKVDSIVVSEIPVDPKAAQRLPPSQPQAKGLRVHVEAIQTGKGKFKTESVQLLRPFPPKPLHKAPEGWLLKESDAVPPTVRQVELAPGKSIALTIRPHILVPDADQDQILAVAEPGFEASLGYEQSNTISAVLTNSVQQLKEDQLQIGNAIDQLQQLIISLPKPELDTKFDSASSIPDASNPIPEQP